MNAQGLRREQKSSVWLFMEYEVLVSGTEVGEVGGGARSREGRWGGEAGGSRGRGVPHIMARGLDCIPQGSRKPLRRRGGLGLAEARQVHPVSVQGSRERWQPLLEPVDETVRCRPVHWGLQQLSAPSRY